jgi:hypothetical protein
VIVREISIGTDQTVSFFHALASPLVANVLTVVLVYCFAMINQREKRGEEDTSRIASTPGIFIPSKGRAN